MNQPAAIALPPEPAAAVAGNVDEFVLYYDFLENQCDTPEGKAHARPMAPAMRAYADALRLAAR